MQKLAVRFIVSLCSQGQRGASGSPGSTGKPGPRVSRTCNCTQCNLFGGSWQYTISREKIDYFTSALQSSTKILQSFCVIFWMERQRQIIRKMMSLFYYLRFFFFCYYKVTLEILVNQWTWMGAWPECHS